MRILRNIITGIHNLWMWKRVIWNDGWWDYIYLLKIIQFKFKLMEEGFRTDGLSVDKDKVIKSLRTCRLLLDRLIDDDYYVYKNYFKKWGEFEITDKNDRLSLRQKNIVTEHDKYEANKEFKRLSEHEQMLRQQDLDYFCKLFNKHLFKWWD